MRPFNTLFRSSQNSLRIPRLRFLPYSQIRAPEHALSQRLSANEHSLRGNLYV